ncbi:uncharacterized protein LOC125203364 isoform X2 [Salvia hispanica]|uniref:uncharacterized protein LOC125203364 isoform X2 n=1 Tax=Salvia hispanica TaxID=49212 RepID=UPI0020095C4F|nr:uncharacterized protein LOC125203364 isoform X2 [Salvia hispanica]
MRVVELGDSGGVTWRRSWRIKLTPRLKLVVNLLRFRYRQIDHAAGDVSVAVGIEAVHLRSEDVPAHVRSISFRAKISQLFGF